MSDPEGQVDPSVIPPLDATLLRLSDTELAFLHSTISEDDDKLKKIVGDVQKRAYEMYPYPCIRAFHFVSLMMATNDVYPAVLETGKRDRTSLLLDLGCCMGTDVRKVVQDGYPANQVLGCDIRPEYITLGHELFADAGRSPIRFFTANVFDLSPAPSAAESSPTAAPEDLEKLLSPSTVITDLAQLRGALTHVYAGALFHLFDEETQYALALRVAALLRRRPGAVVFGRHQGLEEEGYVDDHLGRKRYGHSEASWPRLWKKVFAEVEGEKFASKVVVEAKLVEKFKDLVPNRRTYMLYWSVQIV
ncbi:hypothetical protein BC628DRAFT_1419076 [Trametes gibbosa]|nr:hypothetical protein BC628DRAFT_1419076 [Trametes gibbosa]